MNEMIKEFIDFVYKLFMLLGGYIIIGASEMFGWIEHWFSLAFFIIGNYSIVYGVYALYNCRFLKKLFDEVS